MSIVETARQIAQWPVADRLELIDQIYEQLGDEDETHGSLSAEVQRELDRRIAEYEADPSIAIPWEVAIKRIGRN